MLGKKRQAAVDDGKFLERIGPIRVSNSNAKRNVHFFETPSAFCQGKAATRLTCVLVPLLQFPLNRRPWRIQQIW
jgi:hypothetical protein